MSLSKADFGKALLNKLIQTEDITVLSRWANQIYLDNSRDLELGLKDVLLDLVRMEDAPEFEYSAVDLKNLAMELIEGRL